MPSREDSALSKPRPSGEAERNPYASPEVGLEPAAPDGGRPGGYYRREFLFRLGGILGLILAALVSLAFGLGTYSVYRKLVVLEGGTFDWGLHREWLARMACVILACLVAAVTNWGLIRLRGWGRWALTLVVVVPLPVLSLGRIVLGLATGREFAEGLDPVGLAVIGAVVVLDWLTLLSLLWSPKGRAIFSAGHARTVRRETDERPGCLGVLGAFAFVIAEGIAFATLVLSAASGLEMMGLVSPS